MELFEIKNYQELARRTQNGNLSEVETLHHALLGLAAETLEVIGLNEDQREEVLNEAGDVCWMLAEYCDVLGIEFPVGIAARTVSKEPISVNEAASIMSFGVMKLLSAHQKTYQGHEIDGNEITAHVLTILTGIKFMAEALDGTLTEVLKGNIDKLIVRYPDGFDPERSRNREA